MSFVNWVVEKALVPETGKPTVSLIVTVGKID